MTKVKALINNEELMQHIIEDLEDFPEDSPVTYEVWALGYQSFKAVPTAELLLAKFEDPDKAIEYAKQLTLADIIFKAAEEKLDLEQTELTEYIEVEVETVLDDVTDKFIGGTVNVGTIFKMEFHFGNAVEAEFDRIINIGAEDYQLLDDGSIKVSRELLKDFNKNDQFQAMFIDENNTPILTYKIISKTTNNTFICEFIY